jgi:hypothetical protein
VGRVALKRRVIPLKGDHVFALPYASCLSTFRVSFSALGSPAWLPVPPPAAKALVAPRAPEDRPRRRALLGRRSCSGVVLPLLRYGASAWRSVLRSSGRI